MQNQNRKDRADAELRKVEDELDQREPAIEHEDERRADQCPDHERVSTREKQTEDEWDVPQRERVRAALEVEVNHAAFRNQEADRERPPR